MCVCVCVFVVDVPVLIESKECDYVDKDYKGGGLEIPDHILPPVEPTDPEATSEVRNGSSKNTSLYTC